MRAQNATQVLSVQKQFAGNASYMLQPGEPFPAEGGNPSTTSSVSQPAYPTRTADGAAATSSTAAAAPVHHKSSFPPGAIAGVVVGAVAIIALAAALFYFVGRHRHMKATEAASGMVQGSEKGMSGGASPVAALPGEPVLGPGGMVYVPAQQPDYNRMSMPPMYPQEAPSHPMTPHSPNPYSPNPHHSTISTYDMSATSPRSVELRAGWF